MTCGGDPCYDAAMHAPSAEDLLADVAMAGRIDAITAILNVICRVTKLRFAAVARVTEDRWIACQVRDELGLGLTRGSELPIETTICNDIRQRGHAVVIDHVAEDERFCSHPVPARYGFQSYISLPIVLPDGTFFGTLCALDTLPAKVSSDETFSMFKLFADLVGFHLDAQKRIDANAALLMDARQSSDLREQFIAVLGHDLRNPLAAISAGSRVLMKQELNDQAHDVLALMQGCVRRMTGLIDNVLDFARGRLGGGLVLERNAKEPLEPTLLHVIDELQTAWPDRMIDLSLGQIGFVDCDRARLGQLVTNLVSNALIHGAPGAPVRISVGSEGGQLLIDVSNTGEPIPAAVLDKLFHPFVRMASQSQQHGLGLGLYIASEIARAHGGTLTATSSKDETRFTFRMQMCGVGQERVVQQRAG
ncbi:GAF domain-containing sensor histidine kinase [Peristeroidobacter soli]|uniref:GAF domain-containing sensor histidine kinase n=1 Tax=Peristeroidobacter soli TaxID=2497877 RepID=UPI001C37A167|nr:GAF domain-containing sensor histidine kinase [Peristeroidobacter soli]